MATNEDNARLLVSIEANQRAFAKDMAKIAKQAADAAAGIENNFKRANDNSANSFQSGGRKVEQSIGAQRAAVSNLSFQLNDIATSLAGGASPFTVMAQQGSQVAQVFQGSGGLVGAVKTLGGALAQVVNPVSLASFALIGLTGYAVQYFTSVDDGAEQSDKALKAHADLIAAVAKEWGDAVPALKAYAEAAEKAQNVAQLREATDLHIDKIFAEAREQIKGMSVDITDVVSQLRAAGSSEESILRIQNAFKALKTAIDGGKDSTKESRELTNALVTEWLNTGVSGAQSFAGSVNKIAEAFGKVAKEAEEARRQSDLAVAQRLMSDPRTWRSYGRTDQNADGTIQGMSTVLPDNGPSPERRPLIELDGLDDSARKVKDSFEGLDGTVKRYVDNVVKAESGGDVTAKNPNSSATGVGQFIESTWLDLFKKNFPDRAQNMTDATILALRKDSEISRSLIEAYAKENASILRQAGVSVNEAALQLAHFLGPQGAAAVLTAKSGTPVSQLLDKGAIAANPTILGGGATVDDVIAYAQRRTQAVQGETAAVRQLNDAWTGLRAPTDAHTQAVNQQAMEYQNFGQIAQTAMQGLVNALSDGKLEGKELLQIVSQVVQQLLSMPAGGMSGGGGGGFLSAILGGIGGGGGLFGGMIIPGILHSGGTAGRDGYGHGRTFSSSTFVGAKRYHAGGIAGMQPGEIPAILQRGEVVLPRGTKMGGKGGAETINIALQADQSLIASIADQRFETKAGTVVNVAVKEANRTAPGAVSRYQAMKAGSDYRNT